MALILERDWNNTGIIADYQRLAGFEIHWAQRQGTLWFLEYVSARHRADNRKPLDQKMKQVVFGDYFDKDGVQHPDVEPWAFSEKFEDLSITLDIMRNSGIVLSHHVISAVAADWSTNKAAIAFLSWVDEAAFNDKKKPVDIEPWFLNFSEDDWPFVDAAGEDDFRLRRAYDAAMRTSRFIGGVLNGSARGSSTQIGRADGYGIAKRRGFFHDAADG